MDIAGAFLDVAIEVATYIDGLEEADRQKAIDAMKAQRGGTRVDVQGLEDEVAATKADHAALKADHAALLAAHSSLQATHAALVAKVNEAALTAATPPAVPT